MPNYKLTLPLAGTPFTNADGTPSREWYRWASDVTRFINSGAVGTGITTEQAVDAVAAALAAGSHTNVTVTYDDPGNAISLAAASGYTDEQAQDAAASLFTSGTHSGISFAYDDTGNAINATVGATPTGATTLLLLLNGANGSTTLTDDSASAHTVTASGSTALSTAQARFGTASLLISGSSPATVTYSSDLDITTGDFTVQVSAYPTSLSTGVIFNSGSGTGFYPWQIWLDGSTNKLGCRGFDSGSTLIFNLQGSAITANAWYDIALTRSGSTFTMYVNGTSVGTATYASGLYPAGANLSIGAFSTGTAPFVGYIDHIRINKGEALSIAPLTTEFTS